MIFLQVLFLVILLVFAVRLGTRLLRGEVSPPRDIADLQARVLELEEAVAQIREEQATVRNPGIPADRLLPRRAQDPSKPGGEP